MEAVVSGLPVVSDSGGIEEAICHMHNGILVKEKDVNAIASEVMQLFQEKVLYDRLVMEGYKTAKENDYSLITGKHCNLIWK